MLQPPDRRDPLTADLATLTLGSNPLTPTFDPDVTSYTASVSEASTSLTLTAEDEHATVTVMLNGTAVAASQGAYALTWTEGANALSVTVVNGEWSKTYTVAVTYTPAPGGPQLATLGLTGLTLDPEFDPDVHVYAVTTSNESDDISLSYDDASVGCLAQFVPGEYADYADMTFEEFAAAVEGQATMVEMRHSSETGECEGTATWPETDCCLMLLPIYGETPAPSMNMDEWTWIDVHRDLTGGSRWTG